MSQLLLDATINFNDQNEQTFQLSDGVHSRFIVTDVVFIRNGQTPFNVRIPDIWSGTNSTGYHILYDQNNDTLTYLDSQDKYVAISKGDFTQPDKNIIGRYIYVNFTDIEGQSLTGKIQVWGYGVD